MNRAERRRVEKQKAVRRLQKELTGQILQEVENDRVAACRIFGDFMAVDDPFELEKAIVGAKFSPEGIKSAMSGLPLNNILGGITGEQFIECIFK